MGGHRCIYRACGGLLPKDCSCKYEEQFFWVHVCASDGSMSNTACMSVHMLMISFYAYVPGSSLQLKLDNRY